MLNFNFLSRLLVMCLLSTTLNAQNTLILPSIDDAYVGFGTNKNKNYGSDVRMTSKLSGIDYTYSSFVKFDVSSVNHTVISATLRLKAQYRQKSHQQRLNLVNDDTWSESTITGSTKPVSGDEIIVFDAPYTGNWIEIDVKSEIVGEVANDGLVSFCIEGVTSGGDYFGRYHTKEYENEDDRPQLVIVTDAPLAKPDAPMALSATAILPSLIKLAWTDNADNEDNYVLERKVTSGEFAEVAVLESNVSAYTDTNSIVAFTQYIYRVKATNASGSSDYSNESSATTSEASSVVIDTIRVEADSYVNPGQSKKTNYGSDTELKIKDANVDFTYYTYLKYLLSSINTDVYYAKVRLKVARIENEVSGTEHQIQFVEDDTWDELKIVGSTSVGTDSIRPVGSDILDIKPIQGVGEWIEFEVTPKALSEAAGDDVLSLLATSLVSGTFVAYHSKENGDLSNVPQLIVYRSSQVEYPSAPTVFTAESHLPTQVILNWTDNASNETGYVIERKLDAEDFVELIKLPLDTESYTDNNLSPLTQYTYRVAAQSMAGNSDYTQEVTVTTLDNALFANVVIGAIADAKVSGGSTNTNYGADSELSCKTASLAYTSESFLKFNLSELSGELISAKLKLQVTKYSGLDAHVIRAVADDTWDETSITWNNKVAVSTPLDTFIVGTVGSWSEFDVTSFAQSELADDKIVSLNLYSLGNSLSNFHSKETSFKENAPQLELYIKIAPEAPAPPSDLTGQSFYEKSIALQWLDASFSESAFIVERKIEGGTFSEIVTLGKDTAYFQDDAVQAASTYFYRVKAINQFGASDYCTEFSITTGGSTNPMDKYKRKTFAWHASDLDAEVPINIYYKDVVTGGEGKPVIGYVMNYNYPRIGQESDSAILSDFIDDEFIVITLDFEDNSEARSPNFDRDLHEFFKTIYGVDATSFLEGTNLNPSSNTSRFHYIPEGYRMTTDIEYFDLKKHAYYGTIETIMGKYNSYIVPQLGISPITNPDDMVKPDGSPLDYKLRMDIIYPSQPTKKVPFMFRNGTMSDRYIYSKTTHYRPHFGSMSMRGYAVAVFDHCYNPLTRNDAYGYQSWYSLDDKNGLKSETAAVRYVKLHADNFGIDTCYFGGAGHSKGAYTITRLADSLHTTTNNQEHYDAYTGFPEESPEPQPWQGPSSHITCSHQSMGNGTRRPEYVTSNNVPTIIACGRYDEYNQWLAFPKLVQTYQDKDANHLAFWMTERGHELPYGYNEELDFDMYVMWHNFFDAYLKPNDSIPPKVVYISPREGKQEVTRSGYTNAIPAASLLSSDAYDFVNPTDPITVQFIPRIDSNSVINNGVVITTKESDTPIEGTWTVLNKGTKYVFMPNDSLTAGTEYTVTVKTSVKDMKGVAIESERTSTFKTKGDTPTDIIENKLLNNKGFAIYPNPTNSILNVRVHDHMNIKKIEVYNLQGKQVYNADFSSDISSKSLNLSMLSAGTYFAKIMTDKTFFTDVFIICKD